MIGTNDLGNGEEWRVVASELEVLLEQLHSKRPSARILLHAILPRGGDDGHAPSGGKPVVRSPWWGDSKINNHYHSITQINARMEAMAAKHKQWLRFVDCGDVLVSRAYSPTDQLVVETGSSSPIPPPASTPRHYLPPHLMYDLLHLTPEGYTLWGKCIAPHVAAAVEAGSSTSSAASGSSTSSSTGTAAGSGAGGGRAGRRRAAGGALSSQDAAVTERCIGRTCRGVEGDIDMA